MCLDGFDPDLDVLRFLLQSKLLGSSTLKLIRW